MGKLKFVVSFCGLFIAGMRAFAGGLDTLLDEGAVITFSPTDCESRFYSVNVSKAPTNVLSQYENGMGRFAFSVELDGRRDGGIGATLNEAIQEVVEENRRASISEHFKDIRQSFELSSIAEKNLRAFLDRNFVKVTLVKKNGQISVFGRLSYFVIATGNTVNEVFENLGTPDQKGVVFSNSRFSVFSARFIKGMPRYLFPITEANVDTK